MAYNVKATLYVDNRKRDGYGQLVGRLALWREVWCEATYSGGSRKSYAGRLVTDNSVVLTTHWRDGIESCSFVEVNGVTHAIDSLTPEGRRNKVHIAYSDDGIDYGD
jgi:hypothetical protein